MKTIQITINDGDMYGVEGDSIDIAKYCSDVERRLSEYSIDWTINRNTTGECPDPTVDYETPTEDEYWEIRNAQEAAFGNSENW